MQPVSKNAIVALTILAAIGLGALICMSLLTDKFDQSYKESNKSIEVLRKDWARATNDNLKYRQAYSDLQDTVMSILVEKGQVEIELNRKTEELNRANARYKVLRQVKDNASALNICDSIVYTYLPDYLQIDSSVQLYNGALETTLSQAVEKQNSIIEEQFNKQDTTYRIQIAAKTEEQKQDKKESRRRKGELVKVGFFGAAVGVLLTLILGK